MESKQLNSLASGRWIITIVVAGFFCLSSLSLSAETYRWKDKDGKVHYGAAVPAEYADQPYDILNSQGIVIEHVEDTSIPMEVRQEEKEEKKGRQPLIPEDVRRKQADKLLVIQYGSEEDIIKAMELEVAQLGYDQRLIKQSYESTNTAIRDQIRVAADRQRANMPISEEQKKEIASLYARRKQDEMRQAAISKREKRIRERFESDLERYRRLTSEAQVPAVDETDPG